MSFAAPVSLLALHRAIAAGETTAGEVLARCRARAAAVEPAIGALAAADWDGAAASLPGLAGRPLAGLPVGVKDLIDTAFLPTAYGAALYAGHRPAEDAAIVGLLRRAGASLPAKTVTTPFAFMDPAATRNPWATERSPGGSSSGSAAAVAAGILPAAIGSQTAGSVVRPASFCGVAGFKPTHGLLPIAGAKPFAPSLDTLGLFAAGVDDIRLLFAALLGKDADLARPPVAGLKLAVLTTSIDDQAAPAARRALTRAVAQWRRAGASIAEITLGPEFAAAWNAQAVIQSFEAARELAPEYREHRAALPPKLATYLDEARTIGERAYQAAQAEAATARAALAALSAGFDALITFASADTAPPDRTTTGSPVFNRLWTLMGVPAIAVPGLLEAGMPIGIQLVGRRDSDDALLATAATLAALLPDAPN